MRVLVTGGSGFVGRRLCSELALQGHEVRVAAREARGAQGPARIISVGSLSSRTDWTEAVTDVDVVIHLAARVHVMKETAARPLDEFRAVNVAATEALARAAAAHGVKRLLFVSSIKVNGEATDGVPFRPSDPPNPQDPYGTSKAEAEHSLAQIAQKTPLEIVTVRPPLVYGAGVGGNFRRLMKLVRAGVPLPLGAVENRRSMIYNGNLASALIACATHSGAAGNTYLVSDGDDLSTTALLTQLAELMGTRPRLVPFPTGLLRLAGRITGRAPEVDRLLGSLRVDSSQLCSDLGWQPPFRVREGLADAVRGFETGPSG